MASISKITLPDGSEYDLKDASAREQITSMIISATDDDAGTVTLHVGEATNGDEVSY